MVGGESRLEPEQCFTGNGHGRSAGHAQADDDVMAIGSLLELVNATNRARRKDLAGCGVGGIGGQAVDSWLGLKHRPKGVPCGAVRV